MSGSRFALKTKKDVIPGSLDFGMKELTLLKSVGISSVWMNIPTAH